MSIRDEINGRIAERRLYNLEPALASDPVERTMLISAEINDHLIGPWPNVTAAKRFGELRADLEAFVKGEKVAVCLDPYIARNAYMGRLDGPSDEVWDVRSRDPRPALRVFGRFAERDVFVALTWSPRSIPLLGYLRKPLGDKDSREWRDAIIECKAEWKKLFQAYEPIPGPNLHDYISTNVFLV